MEDKEILFLYFARDETAITEIDLKYGNKRIGGYDHLRRVRNRYHGYGLKNVSHCLSRYNGKVEVSKDAGIFRVSAYLNSR